MTAVVAGMCAGVDSIADLDVLRLGALPWVFPGVRAPSTLGTFLRRFWFGHVRQLDAVGSRLLAALCRQTPLLPGAGELTYVDVDDSVRATYGYRQSRARAMATPA